MLGMVVLAAALLQHGLALGRGVRAGRQDGLGEVGRDGQHRVGAEPFSSPVWASLSVSTQKRLLLGSLAA